MDQKERFRLNEQIREQYEVRQYFIKNKKSDNKIKLKLNKTDTDKLNDLNIKSFKKISLSIPEYAQV